MSLAPAIECMSSGFVTRQVRSKAHRSPSTAGLHAPIAILLDAHFRSCEWKKFSDDLQW